VSVGAAGFNVGVWDKARQAGRPAQARAFFKRAVLPLRCVVRLQPGLG